MLLRTHTVTEGLPLQTAALTTSASLADQYDHFLIDLDGVVYIGRQAVPGSIETLAELRRRGKQVRFVTNDPTREAAHYARRLERLGLPTPAEHVVPVAAAMLAYLAAQGVAADRGPLGLTTYVVGTAELKRFLAWGGLEILDEESGDRAEVVVVGGHGDFNNRELRTAGRAARTARHFLLSAPDASFPMPDGPWPGAGAMAAAIAYMADRQPVVVGKPEPWLFRAALASLPPGGRVAMVGDNLHTDIVGAQRAGLDSLLVLSGHSSEADLPDAPVQPTYVLPRLADILREG
jgi:HAD superfamily hydrolase (TIGR01450 family)